MFVLSELEMWKLLRSEQGCRRTFPIHPCRDLGFQSWQILVAVPGFVGQGTCLLVMFSSKHNWLWLWWQQGESEMAQVSYPQPHSLAPPGGSQNLSRPWWESLQCSLSLPEVSSMSDMAGKPLKGRCPGDVLIIWPTPLNWLLLMQRSSGSPHTVSKTEPRHPAKENNFSYLDPPSHSFSHYAETRAKSTGESRASSSGSVPSEPPQFGATSA